jgi:hypothetical protein
VPDGRKVVSVTGRVNGWSGHFPAVLREQPGDFVPDPRHPGNRVRRPPLLYVVAFEEAKK